MLIVAFNLQKQTLSEHRRRAVSHEAKRLYREEPNLFEAANKEFKGNYFIIYNL